MQVPFPAHGPDGDGDGNRDGNGDMAAAGRFATAPGATAWTAWLRIEGHWTAPPAYGVQTDPTTDAASIDELRRGLRELTLRLLL